MFSNTPPPSKVTMCCVEYILGIFSASPVGSQVSWSSLAMSLHVTAGEHQRALRFSFVSLPGGETLDDCGLRFLLAVRLHTFLSTSLPPAHRAQLLRQGMVTKIGHCNGYRFKKLKPCSWRVHSADTGFYFHTIKASG